MSNNNLSDWQKEQKKKDEANKLLESTALNGDLEKFIYLTSCEEYKGIIDPACGGNYPLRAASLRGHIPIVNFLINFPEKEKRKQITAYENINAAICAAVEYGQDEVCLYFKSKTPKAYKKFINEGHHNSILNVATMRGYHSTIQLIANDIADKSNWNYNLFIKNSVQYNKSECFEYFLTNMDKNKFNTNENLIEIAHTALYNQRFEFLDKIIKNSELNLNEHITVGHFAILVEVKPDSLQHIIEKYEYQPNKKLMDEINNYLDKKEDTRLTKDISNFVNFLEKHRLQKEIREELSEIPMVNQSKKSKI